MKNSIPEPSATKIEAQDLPETTTYLPSSHPSSLAFRAALGTTSSDVPPKSPQSSSTISQPMYLLPVMLPTQSQTTATPAIAAAPIDVPATAPILESAETATTNSGTTTYDPTKLTTWGPKTYTYTADGETKDVTKDKTRKGKKGKKEKEAKTTKNGYLINPPASTPDNDEDEDRVGDSSIGPPPSSDDDDPLPTSKAKTRRQAEGPKTSTVTVRGSEESTTSETVEALPGGGVRKTWVTLVRIVVVEEEMGEGVGEAGVGSTGTGAVADGGLPEIVNEFRRRRAAERV